MEYKVLKFNSNYGSIYVQFFDQDLNQAFEYNIDIPIENGEYISGDALDAYIKSFSPLYQVARLKEIRNNGLKQPSSITVTEYVEPDLILDVPLDQAKQFAEDQVSSSIERIRKKNISTIAGQENTYLLKVEQSVKYLQNPEDLPNLHYIKEEAEIFGVSPKEIATTILQKNTHWNVDINPKLEAHRIFANYEIRQANTNQEVENALKSFNLNIAKYEVM